MITVQHIYDYLACPHRVYLNAHEDPAKKRPLSQFLDLLFSRGTLYEKRIIESLECRSPEGLTKQDRSKSTLDLMRVGEDCIYQGVLIAGDEQGIPDLLKKVSVPSALGDHSYIPIDIKSGKGYESNSNNALKKTYGIQLAFYARLLEAVQGVYPEHAIVIDIDGQEISFDLNDFKEKLEEILPHIRALVTGQERDCPALIQKCTLCGWYDLCLERLKASNDVTLLPGVGRGSKQALNGAGIQKVEDVTALDGRQVNIKGVKEKWARTWSRQAQVYLSGDIEILSRTPIPTAPTRIYFDFEDDPLQDLIYLYGFLVVRPDGSSEYTDIWCDNHEGEPQAFLQFLELCRSLAKQDYRVYHYSKHEKTVIDRLANKYAAAHIRPLKKFQSKMVDLERQVVSHVVLPVLSYGLKPVSKFIGFNYSDADPGGAQSIAWFEEYQKEPGRNGELKHRILTYNREDREATKVVHDWLMTTCRTPK